MNKHRSLAAALTIVLVLLVGAIAIILVRQRSHAPATLAAANGSGPYLTASEIPSGLAGRGVPNFRLQDARAGAFSSASLSGKPYAITFLYVHCVNVCPLIGREIHDALQKLGAQAENLPIVAISVDPRGDTRSAVRSWLSQHQEPSSFHYLIGTRTQLRPIWQSFYVSPQTPGDPTSSHTAVIWLVNHRGRLAALIAAGVPINTTNLAHDFRVLLQQQ